MLCKFLKSASTHVGPSVNFPTLLSRPATKFMQLSGFIIMQPANYAGATSETALKRNLGGKVGQAPMYFIHAAFPSWLWLHWCEIYVYCSRVPLIFAYCINYNSRECYSAQLQADAEDSFIQTLLHYPPIVAYKLWKMWLFAIWAGESFVSIFSHIAACLWEGCLKN